MSLPFFRGESSLFCIEWWGGHGGSFSSRLFCAVQLSFTQDCICASPFGLCDWRLSAGWAADSKGGGHSILYTTSRKRHHRSLSFRTQWGLVQAKELRLFFFLLIILFNIFLSTKVIYRHHIKSRKSKKNIIKTFDNFTKHRYLLVPSL